MGRGRSSTLVNRNVTIRDRRTSLRLEPAMWDALGEIAEREGRTVHELCSGVEFARTESTLTAAIRVFILGYFRAAATEQGHVLAGHGHRPAERGDAPGRRAPRPLEAGAMPVADAGAEGQPGAACQSARPRAS